MIRHPRSKSVKKARIAIALGLGLLAIATAGCDLEAPSAPELVWGVHGTKPGWLHKPRVAAFDPDDRLYIADLTDRIQVFDRDGNGLCA